MKKLSELKVLIADDEVDVCELLAERLKIFKLEVFTANSGSEALKILESHDVDLIITDIKMQNGSGVDLVKSVRKEHPHYPKIFFITAHQEFSLAEIYNMGVDGFFEKPFDARSLMEATRRSALSKEMLWQATSQFTPSANIRLDFTNIEHTKGLKFASGGFFLAQQDVKVKVNDRVGFEFYFSSGPVQKIRGVGVVRWLRDNDDSQESGYGIEIEHIDAEDILNFVEWIDQQSTSAFIPISA